VHRTLQLVLSAKRVPVFMQMLLFGHRAGRTEPQLMRAERRFSAFAFLGPERLPRSRDKKKKKPARKALLGSSLLEAAPGRGVAHRCLSFPVL
jgi:hypothetical protein